MEPQQRPSQSNAFKPLPEDDLANFEALVDRMMRHRAEAGLPRAVRRSRSSTRPKSPLAILRVPPRTTLRTAGNRGSGALACAHARKIGTGVLVVGAGTAYLAYTNAWRFAPQQVNMAAPQSRSRPARSSGRLRRHLRRLRSRLRPLPYAAPQFSTNAFARTAVPRPPGDAYASRDRPVPLSAAAAPAVVPAPQPAAAPSDCPESIAALGLCASRISKAAK